MVFIKDIEGATTVVDVEPSATVDELKEQLAAENDFEADELRILFAGRQLEDFETLEECGVEEDSTLHLDLRLLGGGKKRKKKVYTTPKKIKHKRKKVKLAVLKFYKISDNGEIKRERVECNQPSCGGGVFMAKHSNRHYCGKCHNTLTEKK